MNRTKTLSPIQRYILWFMREHDFPPIVLTSVGSRTAGFGIWLEDPDDAGFGIVLRAYQDPLLFLRQRGLIAPFVSNQPGRWFAITKEGRAKAKTIRGEPQKPTYNSRSHFGRKDR